MMCKHNLPLLRLVSRMDLVTVGVEATCMFFPSTDEVACSDADISFRKDCFDLTFGANLALGRATKRI